MNVEPTHEQIVNDVYANLHPVVNQRPCPCELCQWQQLSLYLKIIIENRTLDWWTRTSIPPLKVVNHIVTYEIFPRSSHRTGLSYTNIFFMKCLLELHQLNLAEIMVHTIADLLGLKHISLYVCILDHILVGLKCVRQINAIVEFEITFLYRLYYFI